MLYENQMFALEARVHFLFSWLNHKQNWLKTLSKPQLDFLRDLLMLSNTESDETPSMSSPSLV